MFTFFSCVAEAVVENGVKGLAAMVPGGSFALAVAGGALAKYKERIRDAALRDEIARMASATATEARKAAAEAVQATAGGASGADRLVLESYLAQIPATVTQSLKRPSDLTGQTVPAAFALTTPDDVLRLLPPRPPRFRPGDTLVGRPEWHLDRVLGVGGFGEVWLARHTDMGVERAVKFCHGPQAADLRHESRVIAQVMRGVGDNPSVVPLRDAVLTGETPWLLFDYVDGFDLGDWIRRLQRLPIGERTKHVVNGLRQIAKAVGAFHLLAPAVVHRDLKPSNILYDRAAKRLRVTDFGIGAVTAKATLAVDDSRGATQSGRMLSSHRGSHTPLYAGPQQRAGADPGPRDDVHALGVIAYQMLTGDLSRAPGPDYVHDLADVGAPPPLVHLIGRCVAQNPARRPATSADLASELGALASVAANIPPAVPPVVSPSPLPEREPQAQVLRTGHLLPPVAHVATPLVASVVEKLTTADEPATERVIDTTNGATDASPAGVERELDVVVSGNWRMNRVVKPYARWKLVTKLPAKVKVRVGEVYKLDIMRSAKDANVQGLANLASVEGLHELDLSGCKRLTNMGFSVAARLTHMRTLVLSQSSVTDATLTLFAELPHLETLILEETAVTDAGLANLGLLRSLIDIRLSGTEISDAGLLHLAPLRQLQTLGLDHLPITDTGLSAICGLTHLEALGLYGTNVSDDGMNHIRSLSNLWFLDLGGTQITDKGLAHLATMTKLEQLKLADCKGVTDHGLAMLGTMKSLELLDVSGTAVTDAGIALLKAAPKLTHLLLAECPGATDGLVDHLIAMPTLEEIDLTGTGVTPIAATRFAEARTDCIVIHSSFGEQSAPADDTASHSGEQQRLSSRAPVTDRNTATTSTEPTQGVFFFLWNPKLDPDSFEDYDNVQRDARNGLSYSSQ